MYRLPSTSESVTGEPAVTPETRLAATVSGVDPVPYVALDERMPLTVRVTVPVSIVKPIVRVWLTWTTL
jgi:hypothetical protein